MGREAFGGKPDVSAEELQKLGVMRVTWDEETLKRLIGPVLDEVNALRRRVERLEESLEDDGK